MEQQTILSNANDDFDAPVKKSDDDFDLPSNDNEFDNSLMAHTTKSFISSFSDVVKERAIKDVITTGEVPSIMGYMKKAATIAGKSVYDAIEGGVTGVAQLEAAAVSNFLTNEQLVEANKNNPELFPTEVQQFPVAEHLRKVQAGIEPLSEGETPENLMVRVAAERVNSGVIGQTGAAAMGAFTMRQPVLAILSPMLEFGEDVYRKMQKPENAPLNISLDGENKADFNTEAKIDSFHALLNITGFLGMPMAFKEKVVAIKEGVAFPEAVFLESKKPTTQQLDVITNADNILAPETIVNQPAITPSVVKAEPVKPKDIHEIVREDNPILFGEYDALMTRRDSYIKYFDDLLESRKESIRQESPYNTEIEVLKIKIDSANKRKSKIYQDRLDELNSLNDAYINEQMHPLNFPNDIKNIRYELSKVTQRIGEMGAEIRTAYDASKPKIKDVEIIKAPLAVDAPIVKEVQSASNALAKSQENTQIIEKENVISIKDEVQKQLKAIGRNDPEAQAQGVIVETFFNSMAEMYQGKKGNAADWYIKEGANIRQGKTVLGAKGGDKGKIKLSSDNAKAMITLFDRADASTFMHESAHNFLDIMDRYSRLPDAPVLLKKQVKEIRKWMNIDESINFRDKAASRLHERFARAFERYLMEGIAPTKELASVFAKFKKWLIDIYTGVKSMNRPLEPEIKAVFDVIMGKTPEDIIITKERIEHEIKKQETETDITANIPEEKLVNLVNLALIENGKEPVIQPSTGFGKKPIEKSKIAPDGKFVKPEKVIDENGNVRDDLIEKRIEKLAVDEDIQSFIRKMAEENNDYTTARRGVVPQAQTIAVAESMGINFDLLNNRKLGDTFNAVEMKIAEATFKKLAKDAYDASKLPKTVENIAAFEIAIQRFNGAASGFLGAASEAGRALNILRTMSGEIKVAKDMQELFQRTLGKSPKDIAAQMDAMSKMESPEQAAKFARSLRKAGTIDKIVEYMINSMLSGPRTHLTNITSNLLVSVLSVPEIYIAHKVGKILGSKDGVTAGEAQARLYGLIHGGIDGIKLAYKIMKDAEDITPEAQGKIESHLTQAISGKKGEIIRIPTKLLRAEDEAFKLIAQRQKLRQLAMRDANKKGLTDRIDIAAHITKVLEEPPVAWLEEAKKAADEQTFTKELGAAGNAILAFSNTHPSMKFIIPFVRTSINILKYAGERTPLGLFSKEVRDNVLGKNGEVARDTQISRIALGSSIALSTAFLVYNGLITGGGPKDPAARALWLLNHQPYSINIGGMWFQYSRLEPFGTIMGVAADFGEISGSLSELEKEKIPSLILASIVKNITSKTWLQGPSNLMEALTDPERYGEFYLSGFAGAFYPNLIAQSNQLIDPYIRDAHGIIETIKSKIPFASYSIPEKIDVWGNEITRNYRINAVNSIAAKPVGNDALTEKLLKIGQYPSKVSRDIYTVELTSEQYNEYARVAGKMRRETIGRVVMGENFDSLPKGIQQKLVRKANSDALEAARTVIKSKYPSIVQQAIKNKQMIYQPLKED
jgi:hypothetical protein